eukprot:TRINITY_DN4040_c0_g2_i1.p1 TRINITY_DN4040_c0_g2~~TRINITY_DN4040_c0_g2_i1.p1  ORF type:complete len:330 (+),score=82.67 TRINITY_DN4040_c0_g2_i1:40-990(+)
MNKDWKYDLLKDDDDGLPSSTSNQQQLVEQNVHKIKKDAFRTGTTLVRGNHINWLLQGLKKLSSGYMTLDASKPWLCYWTLHSLDLLDALPQPTIPKAVDYLKRCEHPKGGLAGGPGQLPHLAATYAGVNALVILGVEEAYKALDRKKLYEFIMRMKQPDGSFVMQEDGEVDVRASYCALSSAVLLDIVTPEMTENMAEFIGRCQTYEGGIGGFPGNEAHGGYTFCGVAALCLLNRMDVINKERLLHWLVQKQMRLEGGFQGRTNKLVDSCYSFWVGGVFSPHRQTPPSSSLCFFLSTLSDGSSSHCYSHTRRTFF